MGSSSFILQPVLYFGDDAVITWEWVDDEDGDRDLRVHVGRTGQLGRFATIVFSPAAAEAWRLAVLDGGPAPISDQWLT
jgi:hypothetical protein